MAAPGADGMVRISFRQPYRQRATVRLLVTKGGGAPAPQAQRGVNYQSTRSNVTRKVGIAEQQQSATDEKEVDD